MHLTEKQLSAYANCTLSPTELLFVGDHLADCADCCQKLSSVLQANLGGYGAVNFLAGELTATDFHLSFAQIAGYIDQQLDATARQAVTDHLELCHTCQTEIEDLQAFHSTLSAPQAVTLKPAEKPAWWEAMTTSWWFWPTAAAGLALVAVGFYGWRLPTPVTSPPLIVPTAMVTPSSDALPSSPTLAPAEKLPDALSAEERSVQMALATGRLEIAAEVKSLRGTGGNLLSGKPGETVFVVVAPQGVMVETEQPRLQWSPLSAAKQYVVTITDQNFNEVARSQPLTATHWDVPVKLKRGRLYQWQVIAVTAGGQELTAPAPSAPEARFKVLSPEAFALVRRARQRYAAAPLELGVIYARVGLLPEAVQSLKQASRQSPVARQLLQQLQRQLQ